MDIEVVVSCATNQGVDNNQQLIIDYLKKLSDEGYLTIYGFVLMPNHIHIVWKQNKMNGKETPQGRFLKYTPALVRGIRNNKIKRVKTKINFI